MKYVLLFCGAESDGDHYARLPQSERDAMFQRAVAWFEAYRSTILDSDQLQAPESVTHVRFDVGIALIERAAGLGQPGPYQLQAAIAACHAEAPSWPATDWPQIVVLYDLLVRLAPSPVTQLHRAVALREVRGPRAALEAIAPLAEGLAAYHLFYAVAADFLAELGRVDEARAARQRALDLTSNRAEQSLLRRRLAEAA